MASNDGNKPRVDPTKVVTKVLTPDETRGHQPGKPLNRSNPPQSGSGVTPPPSTGQGNGDKK